MAYQAGEVATNQRSLAKHITFNCVLTPSGVGTFTATASIPASDLPSAGAIQTGTVGTLTDATGMTAPSGSVIGFELKDGYARRFIGAKCAAYAQTGGNKMLSGVASSGQITPNGHVAFSIQFLDMTAGAALTPAVAAGTLNVVVEVDYE